LARDDVLVGVEKRRVRGELGKECGVTETFGHRNTVTQPKQKWGGGLGGNCEGDDI
jgi:hypothetical protein